MSEKFRRILRKLISFMPVMKGIGNITFSQYGEDIIMLKMLERYQVKDYTFLDIGANEPISSSNTYNFYLRGHFGVLVEPNIELCKSLRAVRPKDTVLNFGIGSGVEKEADFYSFGKNHHALGTFSKEDAEITVKEGIPIKEVVRLPLKGVNDVVSEHFKEAPTVISLDVEGLDEVILNRFDFKKYRPLLVCVETVIFSLKGELVKKQSILSLMADRGYFVYADTHVNTIFCDRAQFMQLVQRNNEAK